MLVYKDSSLLPGQNVNILIQIPFWIAHFETLYIDESFENIFLYKDDAILITTDASSSKSSYSV